MASIEEPYVLIWPFSWGFFNWFCYGEYYITDVQGWVAENSDLGLLAQILIQQL